MMNDQLTPRKITRLLNLAEGILPNYQKNMPIRDLLYQFHENVSKPCETTCVNTASSNENCESSSGILDLECCEGLSSYVDNLSLGKSTFNPGEMTGRSTVAEGSTSKLTAAHNLQSRANDLNANRHSLGVTSSIEQLEQRMRQQSADITHLMRHSVCSSQFTQVDLTAEEKLFVAKEGIVPVMPSELNMNLTRNMDVTKADTTNLSLGGYFQKRCEPFKNILPVNESPKYSVPDMSNSAIIPEAELWSTTAVVNEGKGEGSLRPFDMTLDNVPVRQPRVPHLPENPNILFTPATSVNSNESYTISSNNRETNIVQIQNLCTLNNYNTTINTEKVKNPSVPAKPSFLTPSATRIKPVEMNPPTYMMAPQLQHLGIQSTEESVQEESSLGMSAIIYNYLGNESDVRASVLLSQIKQVKDQKQQQKLPLNEVDLNVQQNKINKVDQNIAYCDEPIREVVNSSEKPLLNIDKWRRNNENLNTAIHSTPKESIPVSAINVTKSDTHTGSKSPGSKSPGSKSSKSQTTYYTVKENIAYLTPSSGDSNFHMSKRGSNTLNVPSPNTQYKELDKSVDWRELLAQKTSSINVGLAKVPDKWVEISVNAVNGFVGMSCEAPVKVTSLVDSWLTARIVIDQLQTNEVTIDVPRFPVLLSPLKSECMIFNITSMIELKKTLLPFTIYLKDSSIDLEIQQKGYFEVDFIMPMMQVITMEGLNKGIRFQSVQETVTVYKTFVLISDCPRDLQLDMSISEGNSLFAIANLQEIKRSEIKKYLGSESRADDVKLSRNKILKQNKQLCRLTNGNAIKATLVFTAPRLADLKLVEKHVTFNGCLLIHMIGTNILINKIELTATVGETELTLLLPNNKMHLDYEKNQDIKLSNSGTVVGTWKATLKDLSGKLEANFQVSPELFVVHPGASTTVNVQYKGPQDKLIQALLIFKDVVSNIETTVNLSGGKIKPAQFPIKTTYSELSWVRKGRKELKIKNDSEKKVTAKFKISGDGFIMETSRGSGTDLLLSFGPKECKDMLIIFEPSSPVPHKGKLMITLDNEPESAKSVRFYACDAGPAPSWAGLVTCGETALVAASARAPLQLTLHNRSRVPAFISAKLHFNLQYMSVSSKSRLVGARSVVRGRESARLVLHVDWAGVERAARDAGPAAARTLATLSVLTGAEYTRRRIIRILREESNGEIKTENLSEHLSRLVGPFEGEDSSTDELLADFEETRKSLEVLVSGIQELSAQVDLTRELSDDVTILISDDSMLEYRTLCD